MGRPVAEAGAAVEAGPELVGVGHLMPANEARETRTNKSVSISSLKHQPIGQFTGSHSPSSSFLSFIRLTRMGSVAVDFLMIHPLKTWKGDLSVSYARHWRKRAKGPLDVGHRGLGNSYTKSPITLLFSSAPHPLAFVGRFTGARENTVRSLCEAANHGADFVEFDVQISKDKVPLVFHDFHICVNVKRRQNSFMVRARSVTDDLSAHNCRMSPKGASCSSLQR